MRNLYAALLRTGLATALLLTGMSKLLAASDVPGWKVTLPAGASKTTMARIINRCTQPHGFRLEAIDTRFLRFTQPVSNVRIPAVASVEVPIVFDSSGLQPGTYRGRINVHCNDCQRDPGCAQDRDTIPVELTVQEPLSLEGISVREGLLAFDNQEAFENILAKLQRLDRERGRRPGGTTILQEFENRFSHTSLRKDIAQRQERLAESGILDDSNDPDAFFIQDEYLRTVLNERLELQIGSSIFKIWDSDLTLEIPSGSLEVLERLRSGADPFTVSPSEVKLHSSSAIRQEATTCQAAFTVSLGEDLNFSFSSQAKGIEPISHSWTFGDGSSDSTELNPQHTFPSHNPFTVCLSIFDGTGCSHTHCRSVQGVNCFADFSVKVDGHTATFTNQSTNDLDYQWSFGDGTISKEKDPQHTYNRVGDYDVCLSISSPSGCTNKYCRFISIEKQNTDCCDSNDRVKSKWTTYANGNRRFKSVIWQTNLPFFHKWGAKTVNYAKNSKGHWRLSSAETIYTNGAGTIYFPDPDGSRCATAQLTSGSETEKDSVRAQFSVSAGSRFWTKRHTLASVHSVVFEGKEIFGSPLFLTEDCPRKRECRKECRVKKGKCTTVCKDAFVDCRDVCKEEKATCGDNCAGLKGKAKRNCKKECRGGKRICKKECRSTKRDCKQTCDADKKECRTTCK